MLSDAAAQQVLETISQGTDDMVLGLDSGGTIVYADGKASSRFGLGPDALVHRHVADVVEGAELARAASLIGRLFAEAPVPMPQAFTSGALLGEGVRFSVCLSWFTTADGDPLVIAFIRPERPDAVAG